MNKGLIGVCISVIFIGIVFICFIQKNTNNNNLKLSDGNVKTEIVNVNKLVEASWTNMETYVLLHTYHNDKNATLEMIFEIGFERPGDEEWAKGGQNEHFVNEYIEMVNQKCNNKIKVSNYKDSDKSFELQYEDGSTIMWDYKAKKGIIIKGP